MIKWVRHDDEADYFRSLDVRYSRNLINLWIFGYGESVRVVEYIDQNNSPFDGRVVTHSKFFWMRGNFAETKVGWQIHKLLHKIGTTYEEGKIEDFVHRYPFTRQYSTKLVRHSKLNDLLKT